MAIINAINTVRMVVIPHLLEKMRFSLTPVMNTCGAEVSLRGLAGRP